MSEKAYNPRSNDAQFATIEQRLTDQDRKLAYLPQIFEQARKTNGRITRLEVIVGGIVAGVTTVAGSMVLAWFEHLLR